MIRTEQLTYSQQACGRRNYLIFNMFNAISFTCIADNILILFVLAMGSPPYFVTIVASFAYFSNVGMLAGRRTILARGVVGTMWRFWVFRNASAIVVAASPFAAMLSPELGIAVLMAGAFGFYFSTCGGAVAVQPIYGEITNKDNRGKYIALVFQYFMILALATMAGLVLIMRQSKSLPTYQMILLFGAAAGFIAAWFVSRVDESPMPRLSALQSLRDAIRTTWGEPRMRKLLFANCAVNSLLALMVPVSMLALKRGYLIDDQTALLFVLIQMSGSLVISYVSKLLAEHSGPRPLVVLYSGVLMITAGLWIMAPVNFHWYYAAAIFFINGFSAMGLPLALSHYFLNAVPPHKSVGASLIITIAAGLCAGISGGVIGSLLIKFLPEFGYEGIALYKVYFLIAMAFVLIGMAVVSRLEKIRDWEVGKVLSLFLAPRDIRTLFFLNKLNKLEADVTKESNSIEKLGTLGSELSEKELLSFLDSPKFELRARALTALGHIPFGEQTRKALLRELKDGKYSTASIAAQIAGDHQIAEAIPLLTESLDSEDVYLRGKSMVALSRMEQRDTYPKILETFAGAHNPRLLIQGAAALAIIGTGHAMKLLLEKSAANIPPQVRAEILTAAAEIAGFGTEFYRFLKGPERNDCRFRMEFLESLGSAPMDSRFADCLKAVFCNKAPFSTITEMLEQPLRNSDNEEVKIAAGIILKNSAEKFHYLLLICLLGILRKHSAI